ncbi:MAG: DUF6359 domain-containing protein [Candidatus Cryptobacteroides sp.]
MKRYQIYSTALVALGATAAACSLFSYDKPDADGKGGTDGRLSLSFIQEDVLRTKALYETVDTNSFILKVTDESGKTIYEGYFGDSPESFELQAGPYTVSAVSCEFDSPALASPQYGDEQCIVVPPGKEIGARLQCVLRNCGIRLHVDSDFLLCYPKSFFYVASDAGRLLYSYTQKNVAYFNPGKVNVLLADSQGSQNILTRTLTRGDILDLKINVSASASSQESGIRIAIDTTKNWIGESYTLGADGGESSGGGGTDQVLTIAQAKEADEGETVRVSGYIVGGDLTQTGASFSPPFSSSTNLLLGPRSSSSSRSSCLAVSLPKGDIRDALNLVDNPENLGKAVEICGEVSHSYFGMEGLKNVSDFRMK